MCIVGGGAARTGQCIAPEARTRASVYAAVSRGNRKSAVAVMPRFVDLRTYGRIIQFALRTLCGTHGEDPESVRKKIK